MALFLHLGRRETHPSSLLCRSKERNRWQVVVAGDRSIDRSIDRSGNSTMSLRGIHSWVQTPGRQLSRGLAWRTWLSQVCAALVCPVEAMSSPGLATSGHREDEGTVTCYNAEGLTSVHSQVRFQALVSFQPWRHSNLSRKGTYLKRGRGRNRRSVSPFSQEAVDSS